MDLFAFDFSQDTSEEEVQSKFNELRELSKGNMNGHYMRVSELPSGMIMFLDTFEQNGWIKRNPSSSLGEGISVTDEHLIYHTVEEMATEFKEAMARVYNRKGVAWYKDVLPVINGASRPIRWKDDLKNEFDVIKKDVIVEYAYKYGLEHFKNVPESRGHKVTTFDKWEKENILPLIISDVLDLSTYEEVEEYFSDKLFCFGRRDRDRSGYRDGFQIPPRLDYIKIMPSYLELASLAQAETEEDIILVLEYAGRGYNFHTDGHLDIVYPENYSYEDYLSSLTEEDIELIRSDDERIRNMRSGNVG